MATNTSETPSPLAKCPTLTGKDNYTEWAEVMKSNLTTSGCWDIISGDAVAPSKPKPFYTSFNKPSGVVSLKEKETEYARKDDQGKDVYSDKTCMLRVNEIKEQVIGYENYNKLKEKAKNLIMDSVTKDVWVQRTNKDDPKALWDELKDDYQKAGVPELGKELAKFMEMNRSNHSSPQALLNALKTQHARIETTLKGEVFHPKYLSWRYIYEMNKYKPLFDIPLAKYESEQQFPDADKLKRELEAHLVNHPDTPQKPTAGLATTPPQPGASVNAAVADNGNNNNNNKRNRRKRKREEKEKKDKRSDKKPNNSKDKDNKPEVSNCSICGKRHPGECWYKNPDKMPQEVRNKLLKKALDASKGQ
jgi:hypothetical protein